MAILKNEQQKAFTDREALLTKQFAGARAQLGGARRETERQSKQGFDRLKAQTGSTGGSIEKAQQKQIQDVGQKFAEVETGLVGQEAAAQEQLAQSKQQAEQFQQTLDFQKGSFAEQMKFQWAEFDENLKTNFINAAVALKKEKLQNANDWVHLAGGKGILPKLFGDRAPRVGGGETTFVTSAFGIPVKDNTRGRTTGSEFR